MIISRTPYRISFFGGGTDYPTWYRERPGAVLATTINKYCYVTCRYLPSYFEHHSRVSYSRVETVRHNSEIEHPAVRGCLRFLSIDEGVEIHHDGDLPARAGMGSSSVFTVGLLNALYALKGKMVSRMQLALDAIHVEQDLIQESVGSQDQTLAAFGGFNRIDFSGEHQIRVTAVTVPARRLAELQKHLLLVFTGLTRLAPEIAAAQVEAIPRKTYELNCLVELVQAGLDVLNSNSDLLAFGRLLHEAWTIKRTLSSQISTEAIDNLYASAREAGAVGGKVLGAGGGGFVLLFAPPERHNALRERFRHLLHVPFAFETSGSQIIYYNGGSMSD